MSKADAAPDEPWLAALRAGDPDKAWDLFVDQYRALIFATIRQYTHDHDEVMDVFASVCDGLRSNTLARLQRYWDRPTHTARFSSWLVTVVGHLAVDWLRQHVYRRRPQIRATLSPIQQQVFELVFLQRRSHLEAYEILHTIDDSLTFGAYARELRSTYLAVDKTSAIAFARELGGPAPLPLDEYGAEAPVEDAADPAELFDTRRRITSALSSLAPDDRLAVLLFVVYEMPAASVARALDWPNAKAVYNRVYRALGTLRATLNGQGLQREDL